MNITPNPAVIEAALNNGPFKRIDGKTYLAVDRLTVEKREDDLVVTGFFRGEEMFSASRENLRQWGTGDTVVFDGMDAFLRVEIT